MQRNHSNDLEGSGEHTLDDDGAIPDVYVVETRAGRFVILQYDLAASLSVLTTSERQIHQLVIDGCSSAEIARRRNVSKRTVINQLSTIYRKLGVRSRRELIARFNLLKSQIVETGVPSPRAPKLNPPVDAAALEQGGLQSSLQRRPTRML